MNERGGSVIAQGFHPLALTRMNERKPPAILEWVTKFAISTFIFNFIFNKLSFSILTTFALGALHRVYIVLA